LVQFSTVYVVDDMPYRPADPPALHRPGRRPGMAARSLELKVWREHQPDPLQQGLAQLDGYLDRLEFDTGVLAVFDSRPDTAPITERTAFSEVQTSSGRTVTLLRG